MSKALLLILFTLTSPAFALETKPWFGDVYAFYFQGDYCFSRFHKVEGASRQLKHPLNDQDIRLDFGFTPAASFDFQLEGEFGKVTDFPFAFRSAALVARYSFLDDIAGDPVSLTFGFILRGVTHRFLESVSTPYAAEFNAELICAAGKEWSEEGMWAMRMYGMAALGQGNRGFPWTRELFVWQYNLKDSHRFTLFADANIGFGNRQHVDVEHFGGWAKFQHQSIDLGLGYGYKFGSYGVLTASWAHRVFAHNYPEHANFFTLSYWIPFSLL